MQKMPLSLSILFPIVLCANAPDPLVNIRDIDPTIKVDLRYATTDNFTKHTVYPFSTCYVHKDTAIALRNVQQELKKLGLGLLIWDGFRPLDAQWTFWKLVPDPRYVGDPRKGGRHTRGTTVDVTLIDLKTGKEISMPTEFDDFTPKAHSDYDDLPECIKTNRTILHTIMTKHGFSGIKTEWWHFDLINWQDYPVLDIKPETLS